MTVLPRARGRRGPVATPRLVHRSPALARDGGPADPRGSGRLPRARADQELMCSCRGSGNTVVKPQHRDSTTHASTTPKPRVGQGGSQKLAQRRRRRSNTPAKAKCHVCARASARVRTGTRSHTMHGLGRALEGVLHPSRHPAYAWARPCTRGVLHPSSNPAGTKPGQCGRPLS